MAAKMTYGLDDIIRDEVARAIADAAPRAVAAPVQAAAGGGAGGLLEGLDAKSITALLKEVNVLLAARNGDATGAGVPVVGAGVPASVAPAQNPRPVAGAPAAAPRRLEPAAVCSMLEGAIVQIRASLGDMTLTELSEFIAENRGVVVALIEKELKGAGL